MSTHNYCKFATAFKAKGTLAQLVEQWTENPCVPGSIPGGTTANPIAMIGFFVIGHCPERGISSVGLERCLDRAEVTGSNPVFHTI